MTKVSVSDRVIFKIEGTRGRDTTLLVTSLVMDNNALIFFDQALI